MILLKHSLAVVVEKNNGDNASDQVLQIYQRVHQIETVSSD